MTAAVHLVCMNFMEPATRKIQRISSGITSEKAGKTVASRWPQEIWHLFFRPAVAAILVFLLMTTATAHAEAVLPVARVAVLVSMNIRPYIEATQGITRVLKQAGTDFEVILLDEFTEKSRDILVNKLAQGNFALYITVGPDSARFVWTSLRENSVPVLYTMVLDPEKIKGAPPVTCGISLSIPVAVQVQDIARKLPDLHRIGLMFDPLYNRTFFEEAVRAAAGTGLDIIPLETADPTKIPRILESAWQRVDAVWLIPDRTIISETVIQYIIKEALLNRIPVIGYNRFFYESGAALNFIFDYEKLGTQTGQLATRIISGETCRTGPPEYEIHLNYRVLKRIGLPFAENNTTDGKPKP